MSCAQRSSPTLICWQWCTDTPTSVHISVSCTQDIMHIGDKHKLRLSSLAHLISSKPLIPLFGRDMFFMLKWEFFTTWPSTVNVIINALFKAWNKYCRHLKQVTEIYFSVIWFSFSVFSENSKTLWEELRDFGCMYQRIPCYFNNNNVNKATKNRRGTSVTAIEAHNLSETWL